MEDFSRLGIEIPDRVRHLLSQGGGPGKQPPALPAKKETGVARFGADNSMSFHEERSEPGRGRRRSRSASSGSDEEQYRQSSSDSQTQETVQREQGPEERAALARVPRRPHIQYDDRYLTYVLNLPKEQFGKTFQLATKVDLTDGNSYSEVGRLLPKVAKLRLDKSKIPTLMGLGTGFLSLRVLSVKHCDMHSLGNLGVFPLLEELNASFNLLDSLPSSGCASLVALNLEGNFFSLAALSGVGALFPRLKSVHLDNNPCAFDEDYPASVLQVCGGRVDSVDGQKVGGPARDRDSREKRELLTRKVKREVERLQEDEMLLREFGRKYLQNSGEMDEIDRMMQEIDEKEEEMYEDLPKKNSIRVKRAVNSRGSDSVDRRDHEPSSGARTFTSVNPDKSRKQASQPMKNNYFAHPAQDVSKPRIKTKEQLRRQPDHDILEELRYADLKPTNQQVARQLTKAKDTNANSRLPGHQLQNPYTKPAHRGERMVGFPPPSKSKKR